MERRVDISRSRRRVRGGVTAAVLCLTAMAVVLPAPMLAQAISFPPFLELRVPKPPTVATAENGSFLAYEVHVTNFVPQPVTLKSST